MTTILVIEDHEDIRENIAEILTLAGYRVFTAANGRAGIESALENPPDLILSDIMMPESDGYDVLLKLQENAATSGIPFIFITAKTERPDIRKGMELGADDYLTKPFDDVELLSAVTGRLKRRDRQKEFYSRALAEIRSLVSKSSGLEEFRKIISDMQPKKYRKKEVVYEEGERIRGFYHILDGRVKTTRLTEEGRDIVTGIYAQNDFPGINMLFSEGSYVDTAVAIEDAELVFFPKGECEALITKYPDLAGQFIRILSNEVQAREEHLLQIAYRSVRQRIAEALLRYAKQKSGEEGITASRADLAAMSGTAPETVSRTLTDFADEGLLEKKGGLLFIKDKRKLERV